MEEQPMSEPARSAGAKTGLVLCDDLMFVSRITGTARGLGLDVKPARSADMLLQLAAAEVPACVLVDLGNPGLDIADLLQRLRETCSPMPRVIAYGSHVDTATLRAARAAGCDAVLPRSQFVEQLPLALPVWFQAGNS
jgi:CheY-like chemotaxis protein